MCDYLRKAGTGLVLLILLCGTAVAQNGLQKPLHTDPLNLNPAVRAAYQHFYNLDYDGALSRFQKIQQQHPQDPIAVDYVLLTTVFHELYQHDLLDTTLYAHEGFLTSKRLVTEDPKVRQQIESLTQQAIALSNQRIKQNPQDKDAYFARGYARSLHATYVGLMDHSFLGGLREALRARGDEEKVLQLDPQYMDARMIVGIHLFAVASLPFPLRWMAGIAGIGGSKSKGLAYLRESAAHGVITSVESKTALSLFLRHDARYQEAIVVQRQLADEYPHDYLFQLEVANLLKDAGEGQSAIAVYHVVLHDAMRPHYFVEPRLQLSWYGLAETLRGQRDIRGAADAYMQAAAQPTCSDWLKLRSQLNAGKMFDLLHERMQAMQQYHLVIAANGDSPQADDARKFLKTPFTGR
jgi:tetratricopeptide (TPR) repeat protein